MPVRTRHPGRRTPGLAALGTGLALLLTACGSTSGPAATSATTTASAAASGSAPASAVRSPTLSPSGAPSPSGRPTTSASAVTTLQGTVTEGVESGCVVLTDDSGATLANLQGWDLQTYPFGSSVQVTGTFEQDMMTTCQQGTPFEVIDAAAR